jgi:NADPH oxidase
MIGFYTHATGCFVRDSVDPDYVSYFPFYSTEHCLGYQSWRFTIWVGILVGPWPTARLREHITDSDLG